MNLKCNLKRFGTMSKHEEVTMSDVTMAQIDITEVCEEVKDLLLRKNAAYGDSALNPIRVFSKADAEQQLLVRLDDKLSRICRGQGTDKVSEDTIVDLIGYLILLTIHQRRENK